MASTKVSVIVAIYNSEKTLTRLLDSLRAQTMNDFEVLMIDDGSTDGSGAICDKYAKLDKRFLAFHKPNEGIGSTRQFGIEHASGEYTIHADADDWVEPDYLDSFYATARATGADMVISDYFEEHNGRTVYCQQRPVSTDRDALVNDFFYNLHGSPCNKLVKRSTYMDRGIKFMEGLNFGEDKLFNLQLALAGITVSYLPKALYHYDMGVNPDSAIRGYSLDKINQRELYILALRDILPSSFKSGIDSLNLYIVYLAVLGRVFDKTTFMEKYSTLSRIGWKDYGDLSFSVKLVIWTSLHFSYGLALFMGDVKRIKRRIFNSKW